MYNLGNLIIRGITFQNPLYFILIASILIIAAFFIRKNFFVKAAYFTLIVGLIGTMGNKSQTLKEQVADNYGLKNFSKVKSIEFTFNVEFKGNKFKRKWKWEPKSDQVTYWGPDKNGKNIEYTYTRKAIKDVKDEKIKYVDARFINDQYWLLFPFHLVWDNNVDIKNVGKKNYPIGKGRGNCLIVKYANNVGYTPGDIFELYLGKDNMIKEWIYRHGGSKKDKSPATWTDNKNFGGIIISTMHKGPNGKFKLWFTDVNIKYQ